MPMHPDRSLIRRCLTLSTLLGALLLGAPAWAQAEDVDSVLGTARAQIDTLQKRLGADTTDADLVQLRETALAVQARADAVARGLEPALANVQARLDELGTAAQGGTEAADVAEQRRALDRSRGTLDSQLKLARLLEVESAQAAEQVATLRRSRFQAELGERTTSILAPPFWRDLRAGLVRDRARIGQLGAELAAALRATPGAVWAGGVVACVIVLLLWRWASRALPPMVAKRVPAGRLRRSLLALLTTLLITAGPAALAHGLRLALTWHQAPSPALQSLLVGMVGAVTFAAYLAGLGAALLSPGRPSWRLPPLPDTVASHMRRLPLLLGAVVVVGSLLEQLATLVNTGLATAVAINCLFALAIGALLAHALRRSRRLRQQASQTTEDHTGGHAGTPASTLVNPPASPHISRTAGRLAVDIVSGAGWVLLLVSLACLLVGYVALGSFVVKQVVWIVTVLATVYLLTAVIDDAFMALLASPHQADAEGGARADPLLRDQAAVVLSGVSRLAVLMVGLVLIAAPFGQGPLELFQRATQLKDGLAIGEIQVRPGTVLQALAVLALGMLAVRALQRWLADRFLPTTRLDPGMRSSATTLLGYVGAVFVVALALSAVGLGLERIAWVASALSVGIGFGLQAVVSNFVSGLILLAERPVKVGDWVSVGGMEGDIRRINVRATEIQMGDRSTVIVPNSELITKTVRNLTLADPLGLVQLRLPMPMDTDVERVRHIVLSAFAEHADVLDAPAPNVFLDSIDATGLVFNASASVSSPRKAYGVRSELLFDILKRLREANLPLSKQPTMLLRDAAPPKPADA